MLIEKEQMEIIAGYLRIAYKDADAAAKLEGFLNGFDLGWQNAIDHAAQYTYDWHHEMSNLHDSTVKGILMEVEGGIRELEFGDV